MSFFGSIKKSLGLKDSTKSAGHVLGGANSPPKASPIESSALFDIYEVTFTEDTLGMSLDRHEGSLPVDTEDFPANVSRPIVAAIDSSSEAKKKGIFPGDIIISLNGHNLTNHEDFYNFLTAIGRPVQMKFFRPKSDRSSKKFINIFKFSSTEQSQANLSEEEKRNRRDVMSKAAEDRSQSWNKKYLSKDKSEKVSPPLVKESSITLDEPKEVDPTTLKSVEQAKKAEENLEKNLGGFSPFRPHMSFVGNGAPAQDSSLSQTTPPVPSASIVPVTGNFNLSPEELDEVTSNVDDAFAMLISLGESEQDRVKLCVQTVYKMLLNLQSNKLEMKFKSIRMGNKAFQSRVASLPGGIELLLAGGYVIETEPLTWSEKSKSVDAFEEDEGYLIHSMDLLSEKKLAYTISRLTELLEMQSSP